ncbi:MAG: acetate--CoA ligase family protein [Dehalococcoidia bacterium]|nr:acetate--CoA ligase family protein [Dehalococcoidia bacterium]
MMQNIKYLFEPRSVAVLGASSKAGKLGNTIVSNLIFSKYKGKIYPVNPSGGEILGLAAYTDVSEVPGEIDLAVIVIPANAAYDAVKACADKGVKFAAIITSGFAEIGNIEEEHRIVNYALDHGTRVIGPNMMGIYSSAARMNATFGPGDIASGNVAIITQSGALGIAMIGKTKVENIGLSAIVSVGNKADVSEIDLLDYLAADDQTRVIMMYIEGVTHGEKFVDALNRTTKKKPVVVVKSGRSKRGAMAAASHTGSLAGEDKVFDDIARQCGVLRAESLQDAMEWCKMLASAPEPAGDNAVIITNGGGIGVMTADACEKYNINLYDNLPEMTKTFSSVVPKFGSLKNPIDLTGEATAEDYFRAINFALYNDNISSILCLGCETGVFDPEKFASRTEELYFSNKLTKPIVFSFVGGARLEANINRLKSKGVPVYNDVLLATSCMGAVYYNSLQKKEYSPELMEIAIDDRMISEVIDGVRKDGRLFLFSSESRRIMSAVNIAIPAGKIARTLEEAVKFAVEIGYPVVMKVVSRGILHKSDAGGVALDIDNEDEVTDAYEAIMQNCRRYNPDAMIDGIEVSEQVKPGIETIVGARRDLSFGPIVMFGLGGIYVEVMKDIVFRSFPLNTREANRMISQIKTYPLLLGVRGETRKDIDALADAILRVGTIIRKFKDISDIEINPLIAYDHGEGVRAVDVRILLSRQEAAK